MVSVTFAIPEKLKSEMKEFAWVNWSELAKQEVLLQDEKAELFEELEELTKGSKLTDEDCLKFAKLVKERFAKNSGEQ